MREVEMDKKEMVISEIEKTPDYLLDEVLDFIGYLKSKKVKDGIENAIASETSLKKDWLRSEEEEAWQHL